MTDATESKICRLCFKVACKNYYEIVEEKLVMIKTIFLDLDWTVSENSIMCCECFETLQKFYYFKSTCLTNEEDLKTAAKGRQGKVDLRQIRYENNPTSLEPKDICRLCFKLIKGDMCFNLEDKEDVPLMLQKCVPELDLSIVQQHVICQSCLNNLEGMFSFVTICCSRAEKTINNYPDTEGFSSNDKVNLYNVLKLSDIKKESGEMDVEVFMGHNEFKKDVVMSEYIENEELQLKSEISVKEEPLEFEEESESSVENEVDFKTETQSIKFKEDLVTVQPRVTTVLNGNQKSYLYDALSEGQSKQGFVKKNDGTLTSYQCESCSFHTKYSYNIKKHVLRHKEPPKVRMYKCASCSYKATCKSILATHMLVHKDISEVTMHKCSSCSFRTKRTASLRRHLLIHKNPSVVTVYKCGSCSYLTKRRAYFEKHLLAHKDSSNLIMHKCDTCSYLTKCLGSLRKHLLTHKDPSEVTMHKCDLCPYEGKYKSNLATHMLVHKDSSKVTMHKCDSCSFLTKRIASLKRHLLTHKKPSKVIMHKCDLCSYLSKSRAYLEKHLLSHNSSKLTMHKCDSCLTKQRSYRKEHSLKHKDRSEVTIHKCDSCSYEGKSKTNLANHMLVHKDSSKVPMHKSTHLKRHLLTGKSPSKHKRDSSAF